MHAWYSQRPEEVVKFPVTVVVDTWDAPIWIVGINHILLEEQLVTLTAEPSLKLQEAVFT